MSAPVVPASVIRWRTFSVDDALSNTTAVAPDRRQPKPYTFCPRLAEKGSENVALLPLPTPLPKG
jgi:hypothetical protein